MSEIDHIVFDVGRVLIHYDPHLAYIELIPDEAERTSFLTYVCSSAWNVEQDRGRAWTDAEAEAIARHPEKAELIRAFRQHWHLMVSHAYHDSVAILRSLIAEGRDVTLLTNFASDTFVEAQALYPFLAESRGVTVSGLVRMLKPDPGIYAHHAEAFGLKPEATLFFDDSPKNVEGARAAGWNAELFVDAETLRGDLMRYGVVS
jgi:2-haloacid dehalogenase